MGAILDEVAGPDMAEPLWSERVAVGFGKMGVSKSAGSDKSHYALLNPSSKRFRRAAELNESRDDLSCVHQIGLDQQQPVWPFFSRQFARGNRRLGPVQELAQIERPLLTVVIEDAGSCRWHLISLFHLQHAVQEHCVVQ
jgi:hypothetical protein